MMGLALATFFGVDSGDKYEYMSDEFILHTNIPKKWFLTRQGMYTCQTGCIRWSKYKQYYNWKLLKWINWFGFQDKVWDFAKQSYLTIPLL